MNREGQGVGELGTQQGSGSRKASVFFFFRTGVRTGTPCQQDATRFAATVVFLRGESSR